MTEGQKRLAKVIKDLVDNPIKDTVADGPKIEFKYNSDTLVPHLMAKGGPPDGATIHRHALGQICTRMRINRGYVYSLLDEKSVWAVDLLVHNLNTLFAWRGTDKKYLIRSVNSQVRGFLSNAYKCLDSITLIDKFSIYAGAVNAEPHDAFTTDLRVVVQAALPHVWAIAGKDNVKVGVLFCNSEFGAGLAEIKFFISAYGRSMIGQRGVKKRHSGRRLSNNPFMNEQIKQEDSEKVSAEMEKHVFAHLEATNIHAVMAEVELSANTTVDVNKISDILESLELDDTELKKAVEAFEAKRDDLPEGYTMYRLANTLAWLAAVEPNPERKLELMGLAGGLIMKE